MADGPVVTVGIPAFRAAPYVERCIRSALASRAAEVEVILLDDASDDGTADIADGIRDSRLKVVRHAENVGRAENVKRALEVGSAPIVALLPADCAITPESLGARLDALDRHPQTTFAFGAAQLCDASDRAIGRRDFAGGPALLDRLTTPGPFLPSNRVFLSTCAIRRKAYDAIGGLRLDVAPTHRDWDLLLRLALSGPVAYVPDVVAVERVHDGNVTATLEREDRIVTAELLVLEAARTWARERAPELAATMDDAVLQWSHRRIAHALLAIAGYTPSDPGRALGCALAINPALRTSLRYHAALFASALPRRFTRPVLRPVLAPFDRRRRQRWNIAPLLGSQSSARAHSDQRPTP